MAAQIDRGGTPDRGQPGGGPSRDSGGGGSGGRGGSDPREPSDPPETSITSAIQANGDDPLAGLSRKQLEIIALQDSIRLAEAQLSAATAANEFQQLQFDVARPLLEQMIADAPLLADLERQQLQLSVQSAQQAADLFPIQQRLLEMELESIERGPRATPEQEAQIDAAIAAAQATGESDIERFRTQGLEALREELAPGLGLRPSDTPILDRGARIVEEAARQQGQLVTGLQQTGAEARLNFPLAASQLQSQQIGFQQQLAQSTQEFQQQLRQQAFSNRFGLTGQAAQSGLGLSSSVAVGFPNFRAGGGGGGGGSSTAGLLGGIGGVLSGLGGIFSSSKDFKTDKAPLDEEAVLAKVERLPIERWRYKTGLGLGEQEHVGPYAEDFRESFGLGDGKTISLIDSSGVALAAVKGLAKRVGHLEDNRFEGLDRSGATDKLKSRGFGLGETSNPEKRGSPGFGLTLTKEAA